MPAAGAPNRGLPQGSEPSELDPVSMHTDGPGGRAALTSFTPGR